MSAPISSDPPHVPLPPVPPTPATAPASIEHHVHSSDDSQHSGGSDSVGSDGHVSDSEDASSDMDDKQCPCNVQVSESPVFVDRPTEFHSSWDAWIRYLKEYSDGTNQVIRVMTTISCKIRNTRLSKTKTAKDGLDVPYVPNDWDTYQRTYICTHGWPSKARGTGLRPKHFVRSTGCPYRFVVQMAKVEGVWKLVVKNGVFYHNHTIGSDAYGTYHENRKVTDDETKATLHAMVKHGRKRARIYEYLLSRGENMVKRDVDNLVQSFKRDNRSDLDDDDACAQALTEFAAEEGNVVTVDETDSGHSGVMNITSRHQRDMLTRFPELVLVDCTHKTNRYNYQLCTLMVVDETGRGQPIQHSLLERNADWHMSRALDHLLRVDETIADKVQVIMVDKDLNEIRVLKTYFPKARVLICFFHVIKYLRLASRKPEYGKLSPDDHDAIDILVHNMVYAASKDIYDTNWASMKALCLRAGFTRFLEYMEENWNQSTDMWVMWQRSRLAHMRVHTNNHLENWFGKFKDAVHPSMSMVETVKALMASDMRTSNEYMYNITRVGSRVHRGYDEEMSQVLKFTTHFVAEHVEKEYIAAASKVDKFKYDTESKPGSVVVQGQHKSHVVDLSSWACSCSFSCAMRLPCQHAIAYRKWIKVPGCAIPLSGIDERWLHVSYQPAKPRPIVVNEFEPGTLKCKTLDSATKYKEALSATQAICSELAEIENDDEYREYLEWLVGSWKNIRQRKRVKWDGSKFGEEATTDAVSSVVADTAGAARTQVKIEQDKDDVKEKAASLSLNLDDDDLEKETDLDPATNSEEKAPPELKLKLNPKAAKSGRPRSDRKEREADDKRKRAQFNESEVHRRNMGEVTLEQFAQNIQDEKPPLQVTQNRLVPLPVKYERAEKKKPKYVRQSAPVLNENAFYLLPHKLLLKCRAVLPMRNTPETAIAVFTQSQTKDGEATSAEQPVVAVEKSGQSMEKHGQNMEKNGQNMEKPVHQPEVECVEIKGIGLFSRAQIEAMLYLSTLKLQCEKGIAFVKWLRQDVVSCVPTTRQAALRELTERVSHSNPDELIRVQTDTFHNAMLYRLKPPEWADAALIVAFCGRLCETHPRVRLVGVQDAVTGKSVATMDETLKTKAQDMVKEAEILLIPVNFSNMHWCAIIVDVKQKRVMYYDSMNQKHYKSVLDRVAWDLGMTLSDDYHCAVLNHPVQTDGYNCGFFVMLKFWSTIDKSFAQDLTENGLTLLRFHILQYVLTRNSP